MRIYGKRGAGNLFYLTASLYSPVLARIVQIRFILDTGATLTSICEADAIKNSIAYDKLVPAPAVKAVGSEVSSYSLYQCIILFSADSGAHIENLPQVCFFKNDDIAHPENMTTQSLIGIDILSRFKISFENDNMILEK